MSIIILKGWEEGFEKLTLTKLQISLLKMGMKEAKKNVDDLLDGIQVFLEVENEKIANEFLNEILQIGVLAELQQ